VNCEECQHLRRLLGNAHEEIRQLRAAVQNGRRASEQLAEVSKLLDDLDIPSVIAPHATWTVAARVRKALQ
jgi:hypothetical protein